MIFPCFSVRSSIFICHGFDDLSFNDLALGEVFGSTASGLAGPLRRSHGRTAGELQPVQKIVARSRSLRDIKGSVVIRDFFGD